MQLDGSRYSGRGKRQGTRDGWPLRGCVWGVVVALHLLGTALLLTLPLANTASPTTTQSQSLQIQFLQLPKVPPPPPDIALAVHRRVVRPAPPPPSLRKALKNSSATHAPTPNVPTAITWTPTPVAPNYVPGGGLLRGDVSMGAPHVNLPGGDHVRGTPVFHMIDPRAQGLAGVVRFIGGLTGAVDSHCLELATWRAMSQKDRIKNHVDDDAMERIEENYNCSAPHGRPVGR